MSTPSTETKIWLALQSRVNSLSFNYPKAWPGQTFTPPTANGLPAPYLRIGHVTASPDRQLIDINRPYQRRGRLMVTLVYPLGQNVSVYNEVAGKIASHFNDGVKMRYRDICVSVENYPHVLDGYEDNGYWTIPVSIPWVCFA